MKKLQNDFTTKQQSEKVPSFEEGYMNLLIDGTLPVGQIKCLKCGCTKLLL